MPGCQSRLAPRGLVAFLATATQCAKQAPSPEWPDTSAGRWLRDYVAAVRGSAYPRVAA